MWYSGVDKVFIFSFDESIEVKHLISMQPIEVTRKDETQTQWYFVVSVGYDTSKIGFSIEVDKDYWVELTEERRSPEYLVRTSFHFLLKRKPSILLKRNFNLKELKESFPEYEDEMKRKTQRRWLGMFPI